MRYSSSPSHKNLTPTTPKCLPRSLHEAQKSADARAHKLKQQLDAMAAVQDNVMSLRKAAAFYGVSRSTLSDLLQRKVAPGARGGAPLIIPLDVEAELVKTLIRCKEAGVGIQGFQLPKIVSRIAVSLGRKDASWLPDEGWLSRFWDRNPDLSVKLGGKISRARKIQWNRIAVAKWYASVKDLLSRYKDEEIGNVDDTGFDLETCLDKVSDSSASISAAPTLALNLYL
jgi:helix-turn-helix, Psq domain